MEQDWKLVEKNKARLENLRLFKSPKGIYIYIPAKMKEKLHYPKYYNLYVRGTQIMLQFTDKVESYTRKVPKNVTIRLPLATLGFSLKPITIKNLESEIDSGNLFIDLKPFIEEKE